MDGVLEHSAPGQAGVDDRVPLPREVAAVHTSSEKCGARSPDGGWSSHAQLPTMCHPLP
jgi:hypothetical protein